MPIERPRVRATDGSGEVGLSVYRHFADRDPLTRIVLERMLAGVAPLTPGVAVQTLGQWLAWCGGNEHSASCRAAAHFGANWLARAVHAWRYCQVSGRDGIPARARSRRSASQQEPTSGSSAT